MLNLPGIRLEDALLRVQGDERKLVKYIMQLVHECQTNRPAMLAHLAAGAFDDLHAAVHRLKGASSAVSAIYLYETLAEAEAAIGQQDEALLGQLIEKVQAYADLLEACLIKHSP